jgi:hypothetical protein
MEEQSMKENLDGLIVLENIPLRLTVEGFADRLKLRDEMPEQTGILLEEALSLISGKAVFKTCYVDSRSESAVIVNGVSLNSRVLRKQLEKAERVFAYVVTIGGGLDEKARACSDALHRYYYDEIGNVAVVKVRDYLKEHLQSRFRIKGLSTLGPGQLRDWPLEGQRTLFSLLGDVQGAIGVKLTESLLMRPVKSLSGLYFPTETTFFACRLCPRAECPSRKAKYDPTLAEEYETAKADADPGFAKNRS